jgi:hypothetical protein
MSAGSGITHAEYNLEPGVTRIFQIWIIPDRRGEKPSWGSQAFPKGDRAGAFVTLASGMAGDHDVLPLRTDARVLGATIQAGDSVEYHFAHADRYGYLVLATGLPPSTAWTCASRMARPSTAKPASGSLPAKTPKSCWLTPPRCPSHSPGACACAALFPSTLIPSTRKALPCPIAITWKF